MTRRAFTLIEALIAILVVSLVATVALGGISSALSATSRLRHQERGLELAADKLERLVATEAWRSSPSSGRFEPADFGAGSEAYRWQLRSSSRYDGRVQTLDLEVLWNDDRDSLALSTLVPADGFGATP
jgi:prepilin-type N-terminal cleavage/methylation domain-containing protein